LNDQAALPMLRPANAATRNPKNCTAVNAGSRCSRPHRLPDAERRRS
jgi:hypothetical protein